MAIRIKDDSGRVSAIVDKFLISFPYEYCESLYRAFEKELCLSKPVTPRLTELCMLYPTPEAFAKGVMSHYGVSRCEQFYFEFGTKLGLHHSNVHYSGNSASELAKEFIEKKGKYFCKKMWLAFGELLKAPGNRRIKENRCLDIIGTNDPGVIANRFMEQLDYRLCYDFYKSLEKELNLAGLLAIKDG